VKTSAEVQPGQPDAGYDVLPEAGLDGAGVDAAVLVKTRLIWFVWPETIVAVVDAVASTLPVADWPSNSEPSKRTEPGATCRFKEQVVVQFDTACETAPPFVAVSFTDATDAVAAVLLDALVFVEPITTVTLTAALDAVPGSAARFAPPPPPPPPHDARNNVAQRAGNSEATLHDACLVAFNLRTSDLRDALTA
jgi:hypothetical protein